LLVSWQILIKLAIIPALPHREKEDRNYRIAAGKVMVIPTPTAEPFKATIVGL
jgi:hypothetical protein